jgi:hypothetical protein
MGMGQLHPLLQQQRLLGWQDAAASSCTQQRHLLRVQKALRALCMGKGSCSCGRRQLQRMMHVERWAFIKLCHIEWSQSLQGWGVVS